MFIVKCGTGSALGFSAKVAFPSAIWYILLNCVINEEKQQVDLQSDIITI